MKMLFTLQDGTVIEKTEDLGINSKVFFIMK